MSNARAGLALPVRGERVAIEQESDGTIVIRDLNGDAVGRATIDVHGDGVVFVRELCIDDERRGRGRGSESAQLIARAAAAAGTTTVRAWAPPDIGLAVYFWIRMGFRPLHGEGPGGGIWFERRLG